MCCTNSRLFPQKNKKNFLVKEVTNRIEAMWKALNFIGGAFVTAIIIYLSNWIAAKNVDFGALSNELIAIGFLTIVFFFFAIAMIVVSVFFNGSLTGLIRRITHLAQRVGDIDGKEEIKMNSPISLTEKGQELLDTANGQNLAKKYYSAVKLSSSASNYEVQEKCLFFAEFDLLDELEEQEKIELENLAYQRGISIERILRVIGIEMRDLILAEREANKTPATG